MAYRCYFLLSKQRRQWLKRNMQHRTCHEWNTKSHQWTENGGARNHKNHLTCCLTWSLSPTWTIQWPIQSCNIIIHHKYLSKHKPFFSNLNICVCLIHIIEHIYIPRENEASYWELPIRGSLLKLFLRTHAITAINEIDYNMG